MKIVTGYVLLWISVITGIVASVALIPGEVVEVNPDVGIQWDEVELDRGYDFGGAPTDQLSFEDQHESYQLILLLRRQVREMQRIMEEEFGVPE